MKTIAPIMGIVVGLATASVAHADPSKVVRLAALQKEEARLERRIDQALQWLFRYQVEAATYRSRLAVLQAQWQDLFSQAGLASAPSTRSFPPAPKTGFRIDAAIGSGALGMQEAFAAPGCRKRRGCRVWLRVSFANDLVKKRAPFEVAVDFKAVGGAKKRYGVPPIEAAVKQSVMIVDIPVDQAQLVKGRYNGNVRVLCEGRYQAKKVALELFSTF